MSRGRQRDCRAIGERRRTQQKSKKKIKNNNINDKKYIVPGRGFAAPIRGCRPVYIMMHTHDIIIVIVYASVGDLSSKCTPNL